LFLIARHKAHKLSKTAASSAVLQREDRLL